MTPSNSIIFSDRSEEQKYSHTSLTIFSRCAREGTSSRERKPVITDISIATMAVVDQDKWLGGETYSGYSYRFATPLDIYTNTIYSEIRAYDALYTPIRICQCEHTPRSRSLAGKRRTPVTVALASDSDPNSRSFDCIQVPRSKWRYIF